MVRAILILALLAGAPKKNRIGEAEEIRDEKNGLIYLLPAGLVTRSATPERIQLTGESANVFSVVMQIELVAHQDQDLEDLFGDLGGGLNGPKVVKGWLCGDKVEEKGKKNTRVVAIARCVGKGREKKTLVMVTVRSTPEDLANLGGLATLQKVGASIRPLGKVRR